jgi:large subunit ribosomal protein L15
MQFHQLASTTKNKNKKRVARGGKRGTYSGRGLKGQKSRSGARIRPAYRDILKKLPKQRGFKFKSIYQKPVVINIIELEDNFKNGDIISPSILASRELISKVKGKIPLVKILAVGETKKKFSIKNCLVSASAREKIEKAGGSIA